MFVTEANFLSGEYQIPQTADAPNALLDFIEEREAYVLKKLLGRSLYTEFVSALFVDPTADPLVPIAENLIPQKWKDLRDGVEYFLEGDDDEEDPMQYEGVREFLIPFIASEWWDRNASQLSALGESEPVIENSKVISPAKRIADFWNRFIELTGDCTELEDTLYGFLSVTYEADYTTWKFTWLGTKNDFDL
jgi:hypothetical protein